jgi:hypothetical protein
MVMALDRQPVMNFLRMMLSSENPKSNQVGLRNYHHFAARAA